MKFCQFQENLEIIFKFKEKFNSLSEKEINNYILRNYTEIIVVQGRNDSIKLLDRTKETFSPIRERVAKILGIDHIEKDKRDELLSSKQFMRSYNDKGFLNKIIALPEDRRKMLLESTYLDDFIDNNSGPYRNLVSVLPKVKTVTKETIENMAEMIKKYPFLNKDLYHLYLNVLSDSEDAKNLTKQDRAVIMSLQDRSSGAEFLRANPAIYEKVLHFVANTDIVDPGVVKELISNEASNFATKHPDVYNSLLEVAAKLNSEEIKSILGDKEKIAALTSEETTSLSKNNPEAYKDLLTCSGKMEAEKIKMLTQESARDFVPYRLLTLVAPELNASQLQNLITMEKEKIQALTSAASIYTGGTADECCALFGAASDLSVEQINAFATEEAVSLANQSSELYVALIGVAHKLQQEDITSFINDNEKIEKAEDEMLDLPEGTDKATEETIVLKNIFGLSGTNEQIEALTSESALSFASAFKKQYTDLTAIAKENNLDANDITKFLNVAMSVVIPKAIAANIEDNEKFKVLTSKDAMILAEKSPSGYEALLNTSSGLSKEQITSIMQDKSLGTKATYKENLENLLSAPLPYSNNDKTILKHLVDINASICGAPVLEYVKAGNLSIGKHTSSLLNQQEEQFKRNISSEGSIRFFV